MDRDEYFARMVVSCIVVGVFALTLFMLGLVAAGAVERPWIWAFSPILSMAGLIAAIFLIAGVWIVLKAVVAGVKLRRGAGG